VRLQRAERREQLLSAATRAFARSGFAATSIDDIAAEAGVTAVILYRHFDSKADLYRAVLDRVSARLASTVGTDDFTDAANAALVEAARADPDGFRLLFRYAAREPEFRDRIDTTAAIATDTARRNLATRLQDQEWAGWAAQLIPVVTLEAVLAWLDAGQPQPEQAADRIARLVDSVIDAAVHAPPPPA
jgi:AcrR family transcriptional regulator